MNDDNVTTGAYVGSKMYSEGLTEAKSTICTAFGTEHILNHRNYLKNTVENGYEISGEWYDSTVELMTEQNLFGCRFYGNGICSGIAWLKTIDSVQYPLFAFRKDLIANLEFMWLRDVATASHFAFVEGNGTPDFHGASSIGGVRPAFSIYSAESEVL